MPTPDFTHRLRRVQRDKASLVCVGLDPDANRLPQHLLKKYSLPDAVIAFNERIIEATAGSASAYKLNLAFYEALGADAWRVLQSTLGAIPEDTITIADGKRGDIGNSARFYAQTTFVDLGFDACTVSGYMGRDSVDPFLGFEGRGVFLLVRTSNPGGADFQRLDCGGQRLFERIARTSRTWDDDRPGTMGFVVGATDVDALQRIREISPSEPLLIPGIGAQGGDAESVTALSSSGDGPLVINSSRSIIYASPEMDFAEAAGDAAEELRVRLEKFRH